MIEEQYDHWHHELRYGKTVDDRVFALQMVEKYERLYIESQNKKIRLLTQGAQ